MQSLGNPGGGEHAGLSAELPETDPPAASLGRMAITEGLQC